jgi:uncharacterized protein YndB with AHSA1/START domain
VTDAVLIRAPIGVVYRTLSDLDGWARWHAGSSSRRLEARAGASGDRHALVLPVGRRSWRVEVAVDGWRHDDGLRWRLLRPVTATTEWWLEARPEGTVVHHLVHDVRPGRRSEARVRRHRRAVMLTLQAMKDQLELAVALAAGRIP